MRAIGLLSAFNNESKSAVVFFKHRCSFYFCNLHEQKEISPNKAFQGLQYHSIAQYVVICALFFLIVTGIHVYSKV